jgi:hypothetical protein
MVFPVIVLVIDFEEFSEEVLRGHCLIIYLNVTQLEKHKLYFSSTMKDERGPVFSARVTVDSAAVKRIVQCNFYKLWYKPRLFIFTCHSKPTVLPCDDHWDQSTWMIRQDWNYDSSLWWRSSLLLYSKCLKDLHWIVYNLGEPQTKCGNSSWLNNSKFCPHQTNVTPNHPGSYLYWRSIWQYFRTSWLV